RPKIPNEPKPSRSTFEQRSGGSAKPNEQVSDFGGHTIVIAPAMSPTNSVRIGSEGNKLKGNSPNCKTGT
ncbi:MAG TPA: hypothetical protein VK137_01965, partial [Planctomycetaceae bacterium]|nr:hypothetical protein [Planctomycetaceae bacterium]